MRASNRAQTLVLCGEAGAGKSLAARMLVAALASAADAPPELGEMLILFRRTNLVSPGIFERNI